MGQSLKEPWQKFSLFGVNYMYRKLIPRYKCQYGPFLGQPAHARTNPGYLKLTVPYGTAPQLKLVLRLAEAGNLGGSRVEIAAKPSLLAISNRETNVEDRISFPLVLHLSFYGQNLPRYSYVQIVWSV